MYIGVNEVKSIIRYSNKEYILTYDGKKYEIRHKYRSIEGYSVKCGE